jgi:hypothetical protein
VASPPGRRPSTAAHAAIWTNLQRYWDPVALAATKASTAAAGWSAKTPEQGAATSVLLAVSPLLAGIGGRYFEDCHEAEVVPQIVDGLHGVRDYALDPVAAARLWDVSTELLRRRRQPSRRISDGGSNRIGNAGYS